MFNGHKIACESGQPVLYLFTQPLDVDTSLVKGIFEHLHEEVLLDWIRNYMETFNVCFVGNWIKVVSHLTIIRDLKCPFALKNATPIETNKILPFRTRDDTL